MKLNIAEHIPYNDVDSICLFVGSDLELCEAGKHINDKYDNIIINFIKVRKFAGKISDMISIPVQLDGRLGDNCNNKPFTIFLIGYEDKKKLNQEWSVKYQNIGAKIFKFLSCLHIDSTVIVPTKLTHTNAAAYIYDGINLYSYKFDKYFSKTDQSKDNSEARLSNVTIYSKENIDDISAYLSALRTGVFFARDLVTEPSNMIYPDSYAKLVDTTLTAEGVKVTILDEDDITKLGMNALFGVGQGSTRESRVVVMEYTGNKNAKKVALVGKGVTFDTGGISLKPSNNMWEMKYDMAGSAAVAGTVLALAKNKAACNVVGIIGLVENMPDGAAQKPGDVVKSMSGKTIEILDTDAEGRLVLADLLHYAQEKFSPDYVVDIATLTGAITVALGYTYAGLFCNDDELSDKLMDSGKDFEEKLWRMPLHTDYDAMIKSSIADVANLGHPRGVSGSCTAAHFLQKFIKSDTKWAHLDIAGVAWENAGQGVNPKGATGFGVRLLSEFVKHC